MKFIIALVFIVLFKNSAYCVVKEDEVIKFGFVSQSKIISNFKDARDSLSTWIEEIGKKYSVSLNVKFFPTSEVIYEKFLKKELDMIVVPLPYYFANKKEIDLHSRNYWTLSFSGNRFAQYYLITKNNSGFKDFKGINNKIVSYREFDEVAEIWLDKNSLIENKKSYIKLVKDTLKEEKESTVILDVFFDKAQFGIVTKKTWDVMVELNPAISKSISIIKKSDEIHLPFIGLFNEHSPKSAIDMFFNLTRDVRKLYNSEEMLDLLKFDSIFAIDSKYLDPLELYYNEYFQLKKKYE